MVCKPRNATDDRRTFVLQGPRGQLLLHREGPPTGPHTEYLCGREKKKKFPPSSSLTNLLSHLLPCLLCHLLDLLLPNLLPPSPGTPNLLCYSFIPSFHLPDPIPAPTSQLSENLLAQLLPTSFHLSFPCSSCMSLGTRATCYIHK